MTTKNALAVVGNRCLGVVLVTVALSLAGVMARAQGQVRMVTSLADSGPGSLREALANAAAGDTIMFAVRGRIQLQTTLSVGLPVDIVGPGRELLILDADGRAPVLRNSARPGMSISHLSIVNGSGEDGGCIATYYNSILLDDVVLSGCRATHAGGAIHGLTHSSEAVTIRRSRIEGNVAGTSGGGIFTNSGFTVIDSSVVGNRADYGGGLRSAGSVLIQRSTVSGNSARFGGGMLAGGLSKIVNSTFADNVGSPSAVGNGNRMTIIHSTIAFNRSPGRGTAIGGETNVTLQNSIVAHNEGGNCSLRLTDGGGNLQFPTDACGETIPVADPLLWAIPFNADAIAMFTLADGSPAIDAATDAMCFIDPALGEDQRGHARPIDGDHDGRAACDSGSFELASDATPTPGFTPAITPTPPLPDLTTWGPWIGYAHADNCLDWGPYGLTAEVHNAGVSKASPFVLQVNGIRFEVGELSPGDGARYFTSEYKTGRNSVFADPDGSVPETDEDNNGYFEFVPIPTEPLSCTETPGPSSTTTPTPRQSSTPTPTPLQVPDVYITDVRWRSNCQTRSLMVQPCIGNRGPATPAAFEVVSEPRGTPWLVDWTRSDDNQVCLDFLPAADGITALELDVAGRLPETNRANNRRVARPGRAATPRCSGTPPSPTATDTPTTLATRTRPPMITATPTGIPLPIEIRHIFLPRLYWER